MYISRLIPTENCQKLISRLRAGLARRCKQRPCTATFVNRTTSVQIQVGGCNTPSSDVTFFFYGLGARVVSPFTSLKNPGGLSGGPVRGRPEAIFYVVCVDLCLCAEDLTTACPLKIHRRDLIKMSLQKLTRAIIIFHRMI